jgi:hypothetical protein
MPVDDAGVPSSPKSLRRWVCWGWKWNGRKFDKPPLQLDGRLAASDNPATWTDYPAALGAHRAGRFDGIGFVLGRDNDTGAIYSGLDLDKHRNPETGELSGLAQYALGILQTYAEVSPSRTGAKALALGDLPRGRRADHERGIELYSAGRYFTVTGRRLPGLPAEVMDRAPELARLHAELLGDRQKPRGDRPPERELALAALAGLSARRAFGYFDWLGVGMALHDVAEDLLDAWDQWSRACPEKYQPGVCAHKWASFRRGGGTTLRSLLYWARQDGWKPATAAPGRQRQGGAPPPEPTPPEQASPPPAGRTAYEVILGHFRSVYRPTFRRGPVLYSEALGREVKVGEALLGAGIDLIRELEGATNAPRFGDGRVNVERLPYAYQTWARSAWTDLLRDLPEEEDTAEVCAGPREQFRAHIAAVLYSIVAVGYSYDSKGEERDVQRRSLISLCQLWATRGKWAGIRSYLLWCRRDESQLRVALRAGLLRQQGVAHTPLAGYTQNKLARLAAVYDVSTGDRGLRVQGERAIELHPAYITGLLPDPPDEKSDDLPSHAPARTREKNVISSESGANGQK